MNLPPVTSRALQGMVSAMAYFSKNTGKMSLLGRDKGHDAMQSFKGSLRDLLAAMVVDGMIVDRTDDVAALERVKLLLWQYAVYYDNWQDAYLFADRTFRQDEAKALALIREHRTH